MPIFHMKSDIWGPKGKTPWISLNGHHMGDSQLIIEFLKTYEFFKSAIIYIHNMIAQNINASQSLSTENLIVPKMNTKKEKKHWVQWHVL